jgi:hypothetical protein
LDRASQEIRLLKIHRGALEDTLETSIVTVSLLNAPPYEALSYVWGSSEERASMVVDGRTVEVHQGLFDALHTLRTGHSNRLVWADAICIDQCNFEEVNSQIGIMGSIFASAESVPVYLGKPTERTEEAMRVLRHFTEPRSATKEPPWSHATLSRTEQALTDVLGRPWFTRIWTVQEATLAQHTTFISGNQSISWKCDLRTMRAIVFRIKSAAISPHFLLGHEIPTQDSILDWSPLLNILETQMRQAARREGATLCRNQLDLAYDFRSRKCREATDRYFAIANIVENEQGAKLKLSPESGTSLEEVHNRFLQEVKRIGEIEDMGVIQREKGRQYTI